MPWTASDAVRHTKKADTPAKRKEMGGGGEFGAGADRR